MRGWYRLAGIHSLMVMMVSAGLPAWAAAQRQVGTGFEPDWRPDGRRIAYTRTHDRQRDIHVMNADGTEPERLTRTAEPEFFPRWSPDGGRIAFVRGVGAEARLVVMEVDGSAEAVMAPELAVALVPPSWAPTGDRLVVAARVPDPEDAPGDRPDLDLFVIELGSGGVRRLTAEPSNDWDPAWSPDGGRIAFVSDRGGAADLYLMAADGEQVRALIIGSGRDVSPAWSPDGRWVAFASNRGGAWQIHRVPAGGGEVEQLTFDEGRTSFPAWSPDGGQLLYVIVGEGRGSEDRILVREVAR